MVPDEWQRMSDADLASAAQAAIEGDARAFSELVRRHQHRVLANCVSLVGSPDEGSDLAQEVFLKAYYGLQRYRAEAAFGTWVQRIKINHCLSHLRRKRRRFVAVDDPIAVADPNLRTTETAESAARRVTTQGRVWRVLHSLPEKFRTPLILADLDELPYAEISAILGISLSATKMRIKRAREEFRRRFEPMEPRA